MTKKKAVPTPSSSDLEKYLEHYFYEVHMLAASYKTHNIYKLSKELEPTSGLLEVLCNATLESFLVHCRCLIEFFHADEWKTKYKKKGGQFDLDKVEKDYVAQHYIPNWANIRKGIILTTNVSMDRFDEISRQLSHFSRNRGSQHKWPHFEMYPDLIKLHEHFVNNLPESLKKKISKQPPTA